MTEALVQVLVPLTIALCALLTGGVILSFILSEMLTQAKAFLRRRK